MAARRTPTGGRFIAPFFAKDYRVVALDLHRHGALGLARAYVFEQFVREAREAGRAGGAFDGGKPIVVGHSFGGRAAMGLSRDFGPELKGAVMVDPPFFAPQNLAAARRRRAQVVRGASSIRLRRRRALPPDAAQPCDNLFILDSHRAALRPARPSTTMASRAGRSRFDPHFWEKFTRIDPVPIVSAAHCPLALIRGAKSQLFKPDDADYLISFIAPGSPHVEIPEAEHHVMIDQPLAFVAALRALLAAWP